MTTGARPLPPPSGVSLSRHSVDDHFLAQVGIGALLGQGGHRVQRAVLGVQDSLSAELLPPQQVFHVLSDARDIQLLDFRFAPDSISLRVRAMPKSRSNIITFKSCVSFSFQIVNTNLKYILYVW
jgi:hypothetical protein